MNAPSASHIALLASLLSAAAITAIVVHTAMDQRTPPVRCPSGLSVAGGRCCGDGQQLQNGVCVGTARRCGPAQRQTARGGCELVPSRILLSGGKLTAQAADWQVARYPDSLVVEPFAIDRGEVTLGRYSACVSTKSCAPLPASPGAPGELGLPVVNVNPEQAERYCAFVGGRLPTAAEWRFAASGAEGRRFPWGFTGLVCRRASFGLVEGPCSSNGFGPDLAGARPDGATPNGVFDLSGNVAEWARDPDGTYRARGGSYRSRVAAQLVTAAVETTGAASHVGFRCAYPAP